MRLTISCQLPLSRGNLSIFKFKASLILAGLFLFCASANACEFYDLKSGGTKLYCNNLNSSHLKNKNHTSTVEKISRQVKNLEQVMGKINLYPLEIFIFPPNYFNNHEANAYFNTGRIFLKSSSKVGIEISERTLFHELVHLAVYRLSKGKAPTWLDEGLALYLEQDRNLILEYENTCKMNSSTGNSLKLCDPQSFYSNSKHNVSKLISNYGMKRILDFLAALPSSSEFETVFKDYFGNKLRLNNS